MRKLAAALLGFLITMPALAVTLDVTWQHPTQRVDGTPLSVSEIGHTLVEYGICASPGVFGTKTGETVVPAPATGVQITTTGWGDMCVRGYTVTTTGLSSAASNAVMKVVPEPEPEPPLFTAVETVVYDYRFHPTQGPRLVRAVGTIPYGTACGAQVFGEYHEISPEMVQFERPSNTAVVVAKCQPV